MIFNSLWFLNLFILIQAHICKSVAVEFVIVLVSYSFTCEYDFKIFLSDYMIKSNDTNKAVMIVLVLVVSFLNPFFPAH